MGDLPADTQGQGRGFLFLTLLTIYLVGFGVILVRIDTKPILILLGSGMTILTVGGILMTAR